MLLTGIVCRIPNLYGTFDLCKIVYTATLITLLFLFVYELFIDNTHMFLNYFTVASMLLTHRTKLGIYY